MVPAPQVQLLPCSDDGLAGGGLHVRMDLQAGTVRLAFGVSASSNCQRFWATWPIWWKTAAVRGSVSPSSLLDKYSRSCWFRPSARSNSFVSMHSLASVPIRYSQLGQGWPFDPPVCEGMSLAKQGKVSTLQAICIQ